MNRAIVLELGINGLGTVRSLGTQGVDVIGVYTKEGPGVYSRYCKPILFPPIAHESEFCDLLFHLCTKQECPPVLFPTSDEALELVSKNRLELGRIAKFQLPSEATVGRLLTKSGTGDLASQWGIRIPVTYAPKTMAEVLVTSTALHYPCIYKPEDFRSLLPGHRKCVAFAERGELLNFFSTHPDSIGRGIVQERIIGGDGFIFVVQAYLNADSDVIGAFTARKIRQYPPDFGIMACGRSERLPDLEELALGFLRDIQFKGLADIEFLQERESGEYFLVEINARTSHFVSFATGCGVNLVHLAYRDLVGEPSVKQHTQSEGLLWIDFKSDIRSFWEKFQRREMTMGQWISSLLSARLFAVFDWRDLGPFWFTIFRDAKALWQKLLRKLVCSRDHLSPR